MKGRFVDIDAAGARAEVHLDAEDGKVKVIVKVTRAFELSEDAWDRLHAEVKGMAAKERNESRA